MQRASEYAIVFFIGSLGYALVERLWRGYTHWTMMLTGGICLALIYLVEKRYSAEPRWKRCLVGTQIITAIELAVGFVVNVLLDWAVWDYSDQAFNLFGQICPLYCALWFLMCLPVIYFCSWLARIFEHTRLIQKEHPST